MPTVEASYAQHRDGGTRGKVGLADRIESGNPGTTHGGGIEEVHPIGDARERARGHRDAFGPASRVGGAGHLQLGTVHPVAHSVISAVATTSAEPAHRHPVADRPALHLVAKLGDDTGDLVAGGHRILLGRLGFGGVFQIGMANAAGGHLHSHPAWSWPLDRHVAGLEPLARACGHHGYGRGGSAARVL